MSVGSGFKLFQTRARWSALYQIQLLPQAAMASFFLMSFDCSLSVFVDSQTAVLRFCGVCVGLYDNLVCGVFGELSVLRSIHRCRKCMRCNRLNVDRV